MKIFPFFHHDLLLLLVQPIFFFFHFFLAILKGIFFVLPRDGSHNNVDAEQRQIFIQKESQKVS
jgi:hypothetical protein